MKRGGKGAVNPLHFVATRRVSRAFVHKQQHKNNLLLAQISIGKHHRQITSNTHQK